MCGLPAPHASPACTARDSSLVPRWSCSCCDPRICSPSPARPSWGRCDGWAMDRTPTARFAWPRAGVNHARRSAHNPPPSHSPDALPMLTRLHRSPGHSRARRHRSRGRGLDELHEAIWGLHPSIRGPQIPCGPVGVEEDLAIAAARPHPSEPFDERRVPRRRRRAVLLREPMRVVAPVLLEEPVDVADQAFGRSGRKHLTGSILDNGFSLHDCHVRFHMGTLPRPTDTACATAPSLQHDVRPRHRAARQDLPLPHLPRPDPALVVHVHLAAHHGRLAGAAHALGTR